MRNGEWLNRMAMSDLLKLLILNSNGQCVLQMLGKQPDCRCEQFYKPEKNLDEMCFDCVCSWLNEKI